MTGSTMRKIYDLHDDTSFVAQVQNATQTTLEFGFVPEHGIFGTHAWWDAVEDGRIKIHTVEGHIKRVYMGSMNDWPEFEIDQDGTISSWSRHSTVPEGSSCYVAGRRVRLDYVVQNPRSTQAMTSLKIPIAVWVEEPSGSSGDANAASINT